MLKQLLCLMAFLFYAANGYSQGIPGSGYPPGNGSSSGGGSVFTGSTGIVVTSSASPVFSLADVAVKSPTVFNFSPTVNVTSPTITNLKAGARGLIRITTDGTHTWSWNSIIADSACPVYTDAAATTVAGFVVDPDGSTIHGLECETSLPGVVVIGPAVAAPSVVPSTPGNQDCRTTTSGETCLGSDGVLRSTVSAFYAHKGTTSAIPMTGLDVPIYDVPVPMLTATSCFHIDWGMNAVTSAALKMWVGTSFVASTLIATPYSPAGASVIQGQNRYCNNGSQTVQQMDYLTTLFYAASGTFPTAALNSINDGMTNVPISANWATTGMHIYFSVSQASGSVVGAYFNVALEAGQ
jgi:hypothetical protein